jgi:lysophospholipase L1-like esterase
MNIEKIKLFIVIYGCLVLFGCGGSSSGDGPTPDPDPEIVLDSGTYIALGCGITEGSAAGQTEAWPEYLDAMTKGVTVVNLGNSRTYAVYGAYHIDEYMQEYTPQCVMVLYGVNDVSAGVSIDEILEDLESIVQVVQYYGGDVVLGTIPRVPVYTSEEASVLPELNIGIKALCSTYGIWCADVAGPLGDSSLYRSDGFHPTDEGEQDIAIIYRRIVRDLYGF